MPLVVDNNITLSGAAKLYNARIGINNLFRSSTGTVTASAETAGTGVKENAYKEGFTFDYWRPGASGTQWLQVQHGTGVTADYVALAAHDLHLTGTTFKAQYSNDGMNWTDAHDSIQPGNGQPIMVLFAAQSATHWRVRFEATSAFAVGVVNLGAVLGFDSPMSAPWTPPYLAKQVRTINDVTEGGAFIGRSVVAQGARFTIELEALDMTWIRGTWEAALRSMEQYGFFFTAGDAVSGAFEAEVVYAWLEEQPRASYADNVNGRLQIRARGILS